MDTRCSEPSPEDLALLLKVVQDVTRGRRMAPEDAEDFLQSIQVRLIESNYDLFRRFDHRSSLRTYLQVVVRRLLLDWQDHEYGRWRPSLSARQLGGEATQLECLIHRDRHPREEAIALLASRPGASSLAELHRLAEALPARKRRQRVPIDGVTHTLGTHFEDPVARGEEEAAQLRIRRSLRRALGQLPPDDRRLLVQRYRERRTVQCLAQRLSMNPRALYQRFDKVLRSLRDSLTENGISGPRAIETP